MSVDLRSHSLQAAVLMALSLSAIPGGNARAQGSQRIDELQRQLEQLRGELDRLKEQQAAAGPHAPATAASSPDSGTAGTDPGIQAGPLKLTFGGFAELAAIYRNRNEVADVSSNFNTGIPYPNTAQYHLSEFRGSARQSRISLLTQGPQQGGVGAEAYLEMDFQSSAPTANSLESNSYNPRLRQFYGTYKRGDFYLLAGQAYSLATLGKKGLSPRQEQIPLSIDGQYVVGFDWTRNPQLRAVQNFGSDWALGLSLESPQASVFRGPTDPSVTTVTTLPGGNLFAPTSTYSLDFAPDLIVKAAWDPGFGHYEVYGLGRGFRARAAGDNSHRYGGGIGFGMILPLGSAVDLQLSGLAGRGIGRYGTSQFPDVTVKPDGELATISAYHALLGLNVRANSRWTFYGYAGIENAESEHFSAVVNGITTGFGYGSPLYDNRGCHSEGSSVCAATTNTSRVEQLTLGAWWKYYQGTLGNLQFGLMGSHTRRTAFAGIGGDPDTELTIGMLSFRYYPYQR